MNRSGYLEADSQSEAELALIDSVSGIGRDGRHLVIAGQVFDCAIGIQDQIGNIASGIGKMGRISLG